MRTIVLFFCCFVFQYSIGQESIIGQWKTIDDETKIEKSIVTLYIENNKLYGEISSILEKENVGKTCEKCEGDNKNKPLVGLQIINGLSKNKNDEWTSGTILDPKTGNVYKCIISLSDQNKLKVRGYLGFSIFGRTQYWERVQ